MREGKRLAPPWQVNLRDAAFLQLSKDSAEFERQQRETPSKKVLSQPQKQVKELPKYTRAELYNAEPTSSNSKATGFLSGIGRVVVEKKRPQKGAE